MFENLFVPIGTMLHMTAATITADHVMIHLAATAPQMSCPRCQQVASRIHSRYQRSLADLPLVHRAVWLLLHVRRFFCDNDHCSQRTFCERLPSLVAVGARRTTRLRTEQRRLGLDIGAEAGARLARRQGMPISPSTLLRFARRDPLPLAPTPRVLGVDDFSLRKGQVFGTILVDLEQHRPIDLLPDRSSDSLANWLQAHPGVEVISRDRATEYAAGATRGAPSAVQVADRFHLLQNLREALQRLLDQHLADIQAAQTPPIEPISPEGAEAAASAAAPADNTLIARISDKLPVVVPRTRQERLQAERRARRQERYQMVRTLHTEGVSIHEIARRTGMSRQTVRRFVRVDQFPEISQRRVGIGKLASVIPYLSEQLAAGNDNGAALWRMVRDQHGYNGSRSQLTQWVARHRYLCPSSPTSVLLRRGRPPATLPPRLLAPRRRSARQVSWLLVRPIDNLEDEEQGLIERLTSFCADIQVAYTLGQAFIRMVKTHDHRALDDWMRDAIQSQVGELQSFAAGLQRDGAAVRAALQLPYSNGQVEGQVNRLKFIKRMGYGRANFDLLRQRVLAA